MNTILTFILFLLFAICQGQEKFNVPKKFKNDTFAFLDLSGQVKNVTWTSWNYMAIGNASNFYKGYYKGIIDSCSLKFDTRGEIVKSKYIKKSIQTYKTVKDKFVFKNEKVLLDSTSTIDIKEFSYYLNYKKLIQDDNLLKLTDEIYNFKYNAFADLTEKKCIGEKKYNSLSCHYIYEYIYDKKNNWIEKSVFDLDNGKELITKTKRQIDYY